MVRSMSLVLVVVAVVVLLTLRDDPRQKMHQGRLHRAAAVSACRWRRTTSSHPWVSADRWKATSARGDNDEGVVTWHLGLVTPAEHYAAVEQSNGPVTAFIDDFVDGATKSGSVTISGAPWQRLDGGKPEAAGAGAARRWRHDDGDGQCHLRRAQTLASALRGG